MLIYPDKVADILRKVARGELAVDSWTNGNYFCGFSHPTFHTREADITVSISGQSVHWIDSLSAFDGGHYDGDDDGERPLVLLSNSDYALLEWRLAEASQPSNDYEKTIANALKKHVISWTVHDALRAVGLDPKHGISFFAVSWSNDVKRVRIEVELEQPADVEFLCSS